MILRAQDLEHARELHEVSGLRAVDVRVKRMGRRVLVVVGGLCPNAEVFRDALERIVGAEVLLDGDERVREEGQRGARVLRAPREEVEREGLAPRAVALGGLPLFVAAGDLLRVDGGLVRLALGRREDVGVPRPIGAERQLVLGASRQEPDGVAVPG